MRQGARPYGEKWRMQHTWWSLVNQVCDGAARLRRLPAGVRMGSADRTSLNSSVRPVRALPNRRRIHWHGVDVRAFLPRRSSSILRFGGSFQRRHASAACTASARWAAGSTLAASAASKKTRCKPVASDSFRETASTACTPQTRCRAYCPIPRVPDASHSGRRRRRPP